MSAASPMFERTPIDVGWYIEEPAGTFVFPAPEPLFKSRSKALSNRAVQACPAVNELERDYFVLTAPFDTGCAAQNKDL